MKPGRDLDALVAEKVMGFWDTHAAQYGEVELPQYSTDMAAAWSVVEKLQASRLINVGTVTALVTARNAIGNTRVYAENEPLNFPHAICLAALKAIDILRDS